MFTDYTRFLPLLAMAGWLAMFATKHRSLFLGDCMGLVYHLALIPVVQQLPGDFALKATGMIWLLGDAMIDMASINGADHETAWRARMCVHLPAALWIAGVSWQLTGAVRLVGLPLGAGLLLHALFGPRLRNTRQVLGSFVVPGMIAWLLALAIHLGAFSPGWPTGHG